MNIFDIIGPVMVGPSSSHTAGAVRIGLIAARLLDEKVAKAKIILYGSFAETYKGHGTDRAILAGLMGMYPDDGRIRDSIALAKQAGIEYSFEAGVLKDSHPNTAFIDITGASGKRVSVLGSSVGGGNIIIKKVNELDVEFTGQYNTLIISHQDTPGAIASVTNLLAYSEINIASMKVYRSSRGGDAMMIIETDQEISRELETVIKHLPRIKNATYIHPVWGGLLC